MKRKARKFLAITMLILGLGTLLYPDIANWHQSRQHQAFIQEHNEAIALVEDLKIAEELQLAHQHNATITDISVNDPWGAGANDVVGTQNYYQLLNFNENGVMARIEIPIINVDLPIFHSSTTEVLEKGVGHMPHTSLPVGGYGNHSVLTAHTGLVNARLFTDLELVSHGDIFIITVANQRLAYQVDQINIVYPHEIDILQTEADRDLVTLITCTPYSINSHRLLVRGSRIEYVADMLSDVDAINSAKNVRHLIVFCFLILLLLLLIFNRLRQKLKEKAQAAKESQSQKVQHHRHQDQ